VVVKPQKERETMTEKQEYRIVSVRLTKEEAEQLQAMVDIEKRYLPNYKMSNFLRMIISQWLESYEGASDDE
jgi:hypothetical protein